MISKPWRLCMRNELIDLFATQRAYVNHFFDHLDYESVEQMVQMLLDCPGVVFFTGVGKSGIIAQKIAMTMVSTGTRSFHMLPTDALHGDLGIVTDRDLVVFLSKSGESDELLSLVPYIRNKGARPIAVVCQADSRLERACDHIVCLPFHRELCPFGLAPTTSTAIQLLFGDVLAVALMKAKRFSLGEYAQNHPAGRIGKRITVRVRDLMLKGGAVPLCRPDDRLVDTLVELSNKRCGCLLVVGEEEKLEGIFTDGDLRRALQGLGAQALEARIGDLMTRGPRVIEADRLACDAITLMESDQKRPITVLPVLDLESRVEGLIKMHDLVQSGIL
jgi:arabinose-5-phosphate isomerase